MRNEKVTRNAADLPTYKDLQAESLQDPEYRAEYERTAFAHQVALRVIGYRAENSLTQTQLAERLGMRQPAIARLEAGEHEPSLSTLARLSRGLGIDFHIDITPESFEMSA